MQGMYNVSAHFNFFFLNYTPLGGVLLSTRFSFYTHTHIHTHSGACVESGKSQQLVTEDIQSCTTLLNSLYSLIIPHRWWGCVCARISLQSVDHLCVWVSDNVSVILSPMWPHRITTVNPPSGTPIETCNTLTHTHTHKTLAARWLCRSCHCPSGEQQRGVTSAVYWRCISSCDTHRIKWLPRVEASDASNW